jgi:TRAP-type uncharacterized transport system fused permease subunit
VVARGWVPAFIYYVTVSISVYLLAVKHRAHMVVNPHPERLSWRDKVNLGAFVFVVGGLVALMAAIYLAPMFAALYMFCAAGAALLVINLVPLLQPGRWSWREFVRPLREFLDSYIDMIADITLLLATLSIMTGVLVITGVPTKLGALLMQAAGVNLVAMVVMAFIFGAILGTGLPPAPTYIIVAIVIAPPMIQAGVNPWVVHFFAFFLAVFGELTPPTSITAAITAKIADASFYTTLWRAILICISLFTLMAGVFVHPQLVVKPGFSQIGAALLVGISTIGLTFAFQAQFSDRRGADLAARAVLAAAALVGLLSPNEELGGTACLAVLGMIVYWLVKRRVAKPLAAQPVATVSG